MRKSTLTLIAAVTLLASCDTTTKDNAMSIQFEEYNLIVSENSQDPATASPCVYKLDFNLTKGAVSVSTENLTFANISHAFETDTMTCHVGWYRDVEGIYYEKGQFSSLQNIGIGTSITNLDGSYTSAANYVTTPVPGFVTPQGAALRLLLGYTYNDTYRIRTFWPECFYKGNTIITSDGGEEFSTTNTVYRISMNMEKMTAQCVIYSPEHTISDTEAPTAILLSEIPVVFDHSSYHLEASEPKTHVLAAGGSAFEESDSWKASDFRLEITSSDLTMALISYRISGRDIRFTGSSVATASYD